MPVKVREIQIKGEKAYITLTKGYVAEIDKSDLDLVFGWNWSARVSPHTVYAVRVEKKFGKNKTIFMHREILQKYENINGLYVDHIDRNGINNIRSNLRPCTNQQNQQNQGIARSNTSGFKGVSFNNSRGKFQARIKHGGKLTHLGWFNCAGSAYLAYCQEAVKSRGEYARLL